MTCSRRDAVPVVCPPRSPRRRRPSYPPKSTGCWPPPHRVLDLGAGTAADHRLVERGLNVVPSTRSRDAGRAACALPGSGIAAAPPNRWAALGAFGRATSKRNWVNPARAIRITVFAPDGHRLDAGQQTCVARWAQQVDKSDATAIARWVTLPEIHHGAAPSGRVDQVPDTASLGGFAQLVHHTGTSPHQNARQVRQLLATHIRHNAYATVCVRATLA